MVVTMGGTSHPSVFLSNSSIDTPNVLFDNTTTPFEKQRPRHQLRSTSQRTKFHNIILTTVHVTEMNVISRTPTR